MISTCEAPTKRLNNKLRYVTLQFTACVGYSASELAEQKFTRIIYPSTVYHFSASMRIAQVAWVKSYWRHVTQSRAMTTPFLKMFSGKEVVRVDECSFQKKLMSEEIRCRVLGPKPASTRRFYCSNGKLFTRVTWRVGRTELWSHLLTRMLLRGW